MFFKNQNLTKLTKGLIMIWFLVFGTAFIIILTGFIGFIGFQIKENQKELAINEAFQIAEAGLNFCRWRFVHDPENLNFSGIYEYRDPEGSLVGYYQLEIIAPSSCDSGITIFSTGWKKGVDKIQRKLKIRYSKISLTQYAFLTDVNTWVGKKVEIKGPFHSNGGIRMDGEQNALFTSAKETYICGLEHGCGRGNCKSPCTLITRQYCQCPGIWGEGEGGKKGLWQFPVAFVDFNTIIKDLAFLKEEAINRGIYLPQSGVYGYYLIFKSNGTVDVYMVTKLKSSVWGFDGTRIRYESDDVDLKVFYTNFSLGTQCGPIFIEDNVWVEGDVNGRTTVVAARLPETLASLRKIIIPNNINYIGKDSVLGLIAQGDILIPFRSPDRLEIKAAFLTQRGKLLRYYYPPWYFEPYQTYTRRNYIEIFGSIISKEMTVLSWVYTYGRVISGYETIKMSYDENLIYNPPPYFPTLNENKIIKWEEIN